MSPNLSYSYTYNVLFTDRYKGLSSDSILLYTILRDRYTLSLKNGDSWRDKMGVFIYYTREALAKLMRKSIPTILKAIKQLISFGLLKEKRMGLTKANKLYVQLLDGEKEQNLTSKEKQGFTPDTKGLRSNQTKPNKTKPEEYPQQRYEPKYGRTRQVLAQEYTQRQYTEDFLQRLVEVI